MEWLLWIDIETTGLEPDTNKILQIACVLSTHNLDIVHILPEITLSCDISTLQHMGPWCMDTHTKSGLFKAVLNSSFSLTEAEKTLLYHLNHYIALQDKVYIAGNSVHFDKKFIDKHMPQLSRRLSHQILDVSSIGIACKHFNNKVFQARPTKAHNHTAKADILESIHEYKYYVDSFLKIKDNV
jgi:oligoribonuclease